MGKYKAIMFDLDGTLIPMDMDKFTTGYFKYLWKKLESFGFTPQELEKYIWAGTKSMVKNDGSRFNKEVFWETFESLSGKEAAKIDPYCEDFYKNEFIKAKIFVEENPKAKEAVKLAREKAEIVVLATNPIFPEGGQKTRLSWIDLTYDDFDYVTSYENSKFCKPNPSYFLEVCKKVNVEPKDCLMIGNDETEDMYAASKAGMDVYLVKDTMIPSKEHPYEGAGGSFDELIEMLSNL